MKRVQAVKSDLRLNPHSAPWLCVHAYLLSLPEFNFCFHLEKG